ncbi:hypothetical protein OCH239_12565 [Roseivivax halodurans JCM 10272]|uniref:DUF2254 domain-containing protein n=1 Tax=Roseivivax halodurans JCM 10272 TaxID=1449350 RepID=X7EBL8_9RHOB|nr:DUF2254 domain-containing protein [Roseivivax halodurans]ETX13260.1 hypothetical protein OCH239_12565 [Roseivivax halodurans JCM 10272]
MFLSYLWKLRFFTRRFWVRAALISSFSFIVAACAPLSGFLPFGLNDRIDTEALSQLLSILTNSMLAVTTFSLSIMVTAHLAADANATPRAHRLLQEDGRTQTVIATFIGAFVYALALTVMLNADLIAEGEVGLVYLATVAVLGVIVVAMLRWVAHLVGLGSVEETIRRVEESARRCIDARIDSPFFGGRELTFVPDDVTAIRSPAFGYVLSIDTAELQRIVAQRDRKFYLACKPGDWVRPGTTFGWISGDGLEADERSALVAALAIGDRRDYDRDTSFSLVVLTEIAERALSPGINDPGTAIDVVGRLTRLLWAIPVEREMAEPTAPDVFVLPIDLSEIMFRTLDPIARDGRNFVEVQMCLQEAYRTLASHDRPAAGKMAAELSKRLEAYCRNEVMLPEDADRIADSGIGRSEDSH